MLSHIQVKLNMASLEKKFTILYKEISHPLIFKNLSGTNDTNNVRFESEERRWSLKL